MSCYRPSLPSDATYDVCCFNSLECAQAVCGSFDLLQQPPSNINNTVVQANGTQYCYGRADLINESYTYLRNDTCGDSGFQCTIRPSASPSAGSHNVHSVHPALLGMWIVGLWFISRFSRD